jgi:hypothetical protein
MLAVNEKDWEKTQVVKRDNSIDKDILIKTNLN